MNPKKYNLSAPGKGRVPIVPLSGFAAALVLQFVILRLNGIHTHIYYAANSWLLRMFIRYNYTYIHNIFDFFCLAQQLTEIHEIRGGT